MIYIYRVQILISTYNGVKNLERQIESIIFQEEVEVSLLIRDDGSTDGTIELIHKLEKKYTNKIKLITGSNVGWKLSFRELLYHTENYDFYGFSDQDDIWFSDKIISCIKEMEKDDFDGIKLCHCNALSVNERLIKRNEQEIRIKEPRTHKNAFAMEYFQGCGMLWNKKAMELLVKKEITNPNISHDFWVGLVCYLFGKIYFVEAPKFYHIRYDNSQSSDGNIFRGRVKRLINIFKNNNAYMNPSYDLLNNFNNYLNENDKVFLRNLKHYKDDLKSKINVLLDNEFSRNSILSTLLLKMAIIFNCY